MGKTSVTGIARSYATTLCNARTGKDMVRDVAIQIVIPIALGCISFFIGLCISDPSNIVVGISIVAALMCAMAVLLFQVRAEIRRENNALLVGDDVKLVDETFDDAMWAILVGFLIALYLVIVDAFGLFECGNIVLESSLSAIAIALIAHFVMVVAMCLKRLRAAYDRVAAIRG